MQFVVPQFIDVEPKIIGPISVRQFIILLLVAGIAYVEFELLRGIVMVVAIVLTIFIGLIFAFVKINGQAFHIFMLTLIQTLRRPSLALWRREVKTVTIERQSKKKKKDKNDDKFNPKPEISSSHFAELSLIADTAGRYSPQDIEKLRNAQRNKNIAPSTVPEQTGEDTIS